MARPKPPAATKAGARVSRNGAMTASVAVYRPKQARPVTTDRRTIAKPWQIEAYRFINICGEARYAATLFAAIASRAEIGISEAQALRGKAAWVESGIEVDALAELAPTVRERTKLVRDFMLHRVIAGECYLIARDRVPTDPDPDSRLPIWEIVAVTELRKTGTGASEVWEVRHDNENYVKLSKDDPVIRMWNPDPNDRREAWSPFRSLLPTLREIEYLTKHIFTQVRSRLMSAGVWFLPENMTYPPPPPSAVEGGAETIAQMNEAQKFMASLAASSMQMLEADEVSFPTIVMSDAAALANVDQSKLIKFWSEIDDKAMMLRSDAVRRFALGMDLPPEQVLGSSGLAVTGAGGSAGSVNHWGVWANEEQTISAHVEPALDDLVYVLTTAFLRPAVNENGYVTTKVIAYDTAALRLRQDRSKEAIELYDRGLLNGQVTVREVGFDPTNDMMDEEEFKKWLLVRLASGSATPEQVQAALLVLGVNLSVAPVADSGDAPQIPGRNQPRNLDSMPYQGPPREQHDHSEAPFSALVASCEVLVLRALEKAGNRILNDRTRGKDKDRETPTHLAYVTASVVPEMAPSDFDFSLAPVVLSSLPAAKMEEAIRSMGLLCYSLYVSKEPYSRERLALALGGVR